MGNNYSYLAGKNKVFSGGTDLSMEGICLSGGVH